jgi:Domain of unknown function (DUF4118)
MAALGVPVQPAGPLMPSLIVPYSKAATQWELPRLIPEMRRQAAGTMRQITDRLASIYVDVPVLRPGTVGFYLLAFVSVGVDIALRLAIDPYVEGLQFATFLPAVIITALIGGLGAGLFSVALTDAATAFFVLPPRLSLYAEKPGDVLSLLLYTWRCFSLWP